MQYTPSIQQDNAPCYSSLKYSGVIHIGVLKYLKSNYVKLYNLCNLLVHIHQSQSSDSLLIHSIASILKVFSQCTVYMTV